ncbi:helix-turn-helix domain-containing protein [Crateriforma conspicua]|uniref:Helix-turn-helix domain protein n=1 Tax=Crateriforma conspicua TaxID=2527996 RepID=A0A5C5XVM0_9PLAN|nr:helix-turn-helix domain-containing protein [Crateriforma conspicua]TWT65652.1 Helix-turn-helix domain protein [Crateriforma conspicua]
MSTETKASRKAQAAPINHRGWVTVQMAADYLSVGKDFIRDYTASGDIRPVNTGRGKERQCLKYRLNDLDELMIAIGEGRTRLQRMKATNVR